MLQLRSSSPTTKTFTIRKVSKVSTYFREGQDDIFGMNFLQEFEERIPASSFKDSNLWRKIVEEKVDKLRAEIVLG